MSIAVNSSASDEPVSEDRAQSEGQEAKPLKLIIQIPCFNEAETLPVVLSELPRSVPGFENVEWLIIDDGSTDETSRVANEHGVDHIVRFPKNRGLAKGFMAGLAEALNQGADVIVNTDADNQYCSHDIPKLVEPILEKRAEIVVGARPINSIEHFSPVKKILQRLGSWVVRLASRTDILDAPSGFRAMTREAALQMVVHSRYTYTLETVIQAGQKDLAVVSVPVRVNGDLRPSRLVKSIPSYIRRSIGTIVRIFVLYRAFHFFFWIGSALFALGMLGGFRFLYFYSIGEGNGHIQSLILTAVLLLIGFQVILVAFITDLLAANRNLLEQILYISRKEEGKKKDEGDPRQ